MQPLSRRLPKPLVPIGGMPMVERLLRQIVSSGLRCITVVTGSGGDAILEHIESLRDDLPEKTRVRFHHETEPRGNLGALAEIETGAAEVLLVFADLVTNLNFSELLRIHRERGCNVTLASHYEEYRVRLGELGVAGVRVTDYQEKPMKTFLACSGIALFDATAIAVAKEMPRPFGIADLIRACLGRGQYVTHWTHGAFWLDVNTEEEMRRAESKLNDLHSYERASNDSHAGADS
jgi:NDP-sugar pyrophosphorylase family protein